MHCSYICPVIAWISAKACMCLQSLRRHSVKKNSQIYFYHWLEAVISWSIADLGNTKQLEEPPMVTSVETLLKPALATLDFPKTVPFSVKFLNLTNFRLSSRALLTWPQVLLISLHGVLGSWYMEKRPPRTTTVSLSDYVSISLQAATHSCTNVHSVFPTFNKQLNVHRCI